MVWCSSNPKSLIWIARIQGKQLMFFFFINNSKCLGYNIYSYRSYKCSIVLSWKFDKSTNGDKSTTKVCSTTKLNSGVTIFLYSTICFDHKLDLLYFHDIRDFIECLMDLYDKKHKFEILIFIEFCRVNKFKEHIEVWRWQACKEEKGLIWAKGWENKWRCKTLDFI